MPGPMRSAGKPNSRAHRKPPPQVGRGGSVRLLPASCDLPVPKLPTSRRWTADERRRWRVLWQGPHGHVWDDSHVDLVASYVVYCTLVMRDAASAWHAQELRYLADRLGISPAGMAALGWQVLDDDD